MKRILYVEDDADAFDLILSILKNWDYEITIAHSFEDAMQKIKTEKFDLFLVDYFLPDALGTEFILAAKGLSDTPSLIVTGATSMSESPVDRFGAYGLIRKGSPSFIKDLRDDVEYILG
jgi:two-component system response regulator HydG